MWALRFASLEPGDIPQPVIKLWDLLDRIHPPPAKPILSITTPRRDTMVLCQQDYFTGRHGFWWRWIRADGEVHEFLIFKTGFFEGEGPPNFWEFQSSPDYQRIWLVGMDHSPELAPDRWVVAALDVSSAKFFGVDEAPAEPWASPYRGIALGACEMDLGACERDGGLWWKAAPCEPPWKTILSVATPKHDKLDLLEQSYDSERLYLLVWTTTRGKVDEFPIGGMWPEKVFSHFFQFRAKADYSRLWLVGGATPETATPLRVVWCAINVENKDSSENTIETHYPEEKSATPPGEIVLGQCELTATGWKTLPSSRPGG
jgi:hypothetical protein